VHLHLVILARQICEGIYDANVEETDHDKKEVENENKTGASETPHYDSTVKKLMSNTIPYNIPPNVVRLSDQMVVPEQERLVFESKESVCSLCQGQLSESMYPQGCNSINGNGILITNTNPFIKIDIKIRKCRQSSCKAVHAPYLYEKGLFNVSNKVVVGLDILLEWREFFKDGMPVSNFIRCKLKALEKKTEKEHCLTSEEIEYLVKTLYNGFYAFEALTERNLDESICGICGIVGIVYYGDGNEKNCCTNKEINCSAKKETLLSSNKEETRLSSTKEDNELSSNKKETGQSSNKEETQLRNDNEVNLEETLLSMKDRLVRKMLFPNAAEENRFEIDLDNIPPIIPPKQRSHQFSTEMSKKSEYLKKSDVIEGDAMKLSRLITDEKLSIEDFDSMDVKELKRIASKCDIKQSGKSRALLKVVLQQLYASILVGRSACHQFVKSAGHTGGFYHFVCPHGTTVCSKLMILTESVRDAADLWLSLKYPPVMFICDTPCTFVQHVNKRKPDLAKKYWDDFDGCFEKPTLDKDPNSEMDVPNIVPIEFRDVAPIPMNPKNSNVHPITYKERRYVAGDRFHTGTNPHKSPLCEYHNVNLAQQGNTLKTSYQESMNNKKNKLRNRTSCTQGFLHHFYYNYLMNFYENEEIVSKQRRNLENMVSNTGKIVKRDEYSRFVVAE
uniref:HMG domain-containing protein n=2 Tax=Clytia hemisphaerica TaxID=252671 RepID=A0A7M5UYH7_9CNID